ncbi:hypothetical protein HY029_02565 [Candidatus Gottesmanbacteria bacterium]|nr:hypothetical protein [Candidatus Gottesmanbacteria bacterium]
MSHLTEISLVTKKLALGLLIAFVAYIILNFMYNIILDYWKKTHPIPLVYVNATRFNKIPAPKFTHIAISSSGLKFKLENVEGLAIKDATPAGKVYSMPKKLPTLLDTQRARNFAVKLGFTNPEEPISSTYYRFTDPDDKLHTLEIDTTTKNFKLKYDYKNNPSLFAGDTIQNKDQTITEVKNYIQFNGLFDDAIAKGKVTTTLLTYNPQTKIASVASSLSDTNLLKINFFRNDMDNKKVLPPQFSESYNFVLYTPSTIINKRIIELFYTFWPIALDDFGTYPLRSSEAAWQDLTDGYAFVVNIGNNNSQNQIIIRNIYLAYYDSDEPQNYLQPIYVFEGDNDFVAYLPAVSNDWLE